MYKIIHLLLVHKSIRSFGIIRDNPWIKNEKIQYTLSTFLETMFFEEKQGKFFYPRIEEFSFDKSKYSIYCENRLLKG